MIKNPLEIEKKSFEIITKELGKTEIDKNHLEIIKRIIHTTADFEYAKITEFHPRAIEAGMSALIKGCKIYVDTRMIYSGVNKRILKKLSSEIYTLIDDKQVIEEAKIKGITRSIIGIEKACENKETQIFIIGNAPTALLRLKELIIEKRIIPKLVIGVPVGFVAAAESKEELKKTNIPYIVTNGRKGGSTVAVSIANALLYKCVKSRDIKHLNKYIIKNGKKLRYGYTTGTCAAAAAKAAVKMLYEKKPLKTIKIDTLKGWKLELILNNIEINDSFSSCGVKKSAGDDPDVTNGIMIHAKASKNNSNDIIIKGGIGIGTVLKKGLPVEIGRPAINPVPMKMIINEIEKVKPKGKGVTVEIYAPEGEKIAKKTFNPKLGIEGGISILGTTGIVEPMSEDAIKKTKSIEISLLKQQGYSTLIFTPGNYGKLFAEKELRLKKEVIIKISNYIGYMLEQAMYYKVKEILLIGHIGKMIKIAGGIFNTHSKVADARLEILTAHHLMFNNDIQIAKKIMNSNTTEEAIEYIKEKALFPYLSNLISKKCTEYVHDTIKIEVVLFSQQKGLLAMSNDAKSLIKKLNS